MVGLARTRTLRDVALIFLGAAAMHFTTSFVGPLTDHTSSIVVKTQVSNHSASDGRTRSCTVKRVRCDCGARERSVEHGPWKQRKKGMGPGAGEFIP